MAEPQVAPDPQVQADLKDRLMKSFNDFRGATMDARRESDLDDDYYNGHQLTSAERAVLRRRKQPEVVINRIRVGVNGLLGIVEQSRTDPRAYMRNPPDKDEARPQATPAPQVPGQPPQDPPEKPLDAGDVATMTLRYISDLNRFNGIKRDVLKNVCVQGTGAAITEIDGDDVLVTQVRWEEFCYDPRSRREDFKDARWLGVAKWMYADQVAAVYPEFRDALNDFVQNGDVAGFGAWDSSWEDRPDNLTPWIDRQQRRVMVVEMYYQEAVKWRRCVFYAGGVLEEGDSPYLDPNGRPICPIEAISAYVDRNNNRSGVVRDWRGPQDEINMRRSKLLHTLNSRQIQPISMDTPPVNIDTARQEAARPDGVLPLGYQIVPTADMAAGQANLLAEAKGEIERLSPNPANIGRANMDASGRAQQVRQQAGLTELAPLLGAFSDWELRVYRQMWSRARQFWKDAKWIRVTDDEGAPQYVRINEPTPPTVQMVNGMPTIVPGQPKNHIAEMDVDIVVDSVPDTSTLQQEIFAEFAKLAAAYGPQAVPFDVLVKMSSIPKKQEILDDLEAAQAKQGAGQAQMMQQQAELAVKKALADIAETNSKALLNEANTRLKEVQIVETAMDAHMRAKTPQPPPGSGDYGLSQPQSA